MRGFAAWLVAIIVLLRAAPAPACMNAIFSDDEAVKRVREADESLAEGDVHRARELASAVAHDGPPVDAAATALRARVRARAERVVALSWVRDRDATPEDVDRALQTLDRQLREQQVEDPALAADVGEALARAGQDDLAYERLLRLEQRDLIGSPYAHAALARLAETRGEAALAQTARGRCETMAGDRRICRGDYPRPPLLRGRPLGYALPGAIALVALALRVLSRRRGAPWLGHHDTMFALLVVLTGAAAFSLARAPWAAACFSTVALAIVARVQRGLFFRAVERERVPGFALRPATSEDGRAPALRSLFTSSERVLERTPDAAYREPARVAVLRLVPRSRTAAVLVAVTLAVLALSASCAALTLRAA